MQLWFTFWASVCSLHCAFISDNRFSSWPSVKYHELSPRRWFTMIGVKGRWDGHVVMVVVIIVDVAGVITWRPANGV